MLEVTARGLPIDKLEWIQFRLRLVYLKGLGTDAQPSLSFSGWLNALERLRKLRKLWRPEVTKWTLATSLGPLYALIFPREPYFYDISVLALRLRL